MKIPFKKANILIPKNTNMEKWAVIACDQYTSEPSYWDGVKRIVSDNPSTLNIIIPEIFLEEAGVEKRIKNVNTIMDDYIKNGLFEELKDSIIYLERTDSTGKVRKGIIGMVDLENYSFEKGSKSLIRATEGTILERIPPRVRVRENASLELPHVMLLIDDEKKIVIDQLSNEVDSEQIVYDFSLMQNGGYAKGYKLTDEQLEKVYSGLDSLLNNDYNKEYNESLLFAVGDGNHSLATAKTCYENLKKSLNEAEYINHPARYALVEVVNLHSDALEFEPIHRVLFDVDPLHVMEELNKYYEIAMDGEGQRVDYIYGYEKGFLIIKNPKSNLAVGSLQIFIDEYIKLYGGRLDYIHGEESVNKLASTPNNIGFLLPNMDKNDLFKTVILDGVLPRKTFSMGHSDDKRFYLEARKIK